MRDLSYALRSLRRSPGFVAVAVVCLGVGLGISTTVFAMLDAVVRPYLPYRDPGRLFTVWTMISATGDLSTRQVIEDAGRQALDGATTLFEASTIIERGSSEPMEADGRLFEADVASVGPDYFTFLGLRPRRGRFFQADDAGGTAAVVTEDVWNQHFTGRRAGEARLLVGGQARVVVGVLPRGTRDPLRTGVLLPQRAAAPTGWGWRYVRLRPGQDSAGAARELDAIARRVAEAYGAGRVRIEFRMNPVRPDPFQLGDIHRALAAGGLAILLIACANLANLMLARGLNRRRDLVLHVALGATRGAVVRQMLVEAVLVSLAGGLLGLIITAWGAGLLRGGLPESLRWAGVLRPQISWRVFAFGFGAAMASALLFGLAPAWRASDVRASDALKDGAGTTTERSHGRYSGIVIAEVALTLVLLVGASLLVRSIAKVKQIDFAHGARGLVSGFVFVQADTADARGRRPYQAPSLEVLRDVALRVPGVVGVTSEVTVSPWGYQVLADEGHHAREPLFLRGYKRVTPDYLRTRGLTLLEGRDFADGDVAGPGVVVLDSTAAATLWPGGSAVGRMVKLGRAVHAGTPWLRVVGVTRAVPSLSMFTRYDPYEPATPEIYAIQPGTPDTRGRRDLLIRVAGDEARTALLLQRAIRDVYAGRRAYAAFTPWRQVFDDFLGARRFIGRIFLGFGLLALALAATGLYAVLAYAVSRRLREFAIRIALGAEPRDLVRIVARDAAAMVLAGTAVGGLATLWTGKYVDAWLYEVYFVDAPSLVAAEATLLVVAAAACAAPAWRAMRADPIAIIRAT